MVFLSFQISFGFTGLSNNNNGLNSKITLKLIENIGDIQWKVTKLENNEKQMMESIRALIQNNAQFRLANMEFQKRLSNIEQDKKDNVNKELENRLKNLESKLSEQDSAIENKSERVGYQTQSENGSCEQSNVLSRREE